MSKDNMINTSRELQAVVDSAWRDGFEAGLRAGRVFADKLESIDDSESKHPDTVDDEVEIELEVGDMVTVENESDKYYMVCKIRTDDIVAIDVNNKKLVTLSKDSIASVGKMAVRDVVEDTE